MKLKKAAIWGIAVVLLAGGIAAGAVVLNGRPETKDNLINMAKIIKPRGDKTHVIVKVSQISVQKIIQNLMKIIRIIQMILYQLPAGATA